MITGWLSVCIGIIAVIIGVSGFWLGMLVDWLLSGLEIGTHDAVKARGVRSVAISVPRLYGSIILSIFFGWRGRHVRREQHAMTQLLFWSLLLPFARIVRERRDKVRELGKRDRLALVGDAGNLSSTLSVVVSVGSFLSLLFGLISVAFGILSLVAPWIIDDWIQSAVSLIRGGHPWLGWFVLVALVGAIVLLTWLVKRPKRKAAESSGPSGMTSGAADAPGSENTEKIFSRVKAGVIHIDAHILGKLGQFLSVTGCHDLAIMCQEKALKRHRKIEEPKGEAANLNDLGMAFHYKGELDAAFDKYRQAMEIYKAVDDQGGRAGCLANMGTIYMARKDRVKAIDHYRRALLIFERLGMHKAADRVRQAIVRLRGSREADIP